MDLVAEKLPFKLFEESPQSFPSPFRGLDEFGKSDSRQGQGRRFDDDPIVGMALVVHEAARMFPDGSEYQAAAVFVEGGRGVQAIHDQEPLAQPPGRREGLPGGSRATIGSHGDGVGNDPTAQRAHQEGGAVFPPGLFQVTGRSFQEVMAIEVMGPFLHPQRIGIPADGFRKELAHDPPRQKVVGSLAWIGMRRWNGHGQLVQGGGSPDSEGGRRLPTSVSCASVRSIDQGISVRPQDPSEPPVRQSGAFRKQAPLAEDRLQAHPDFPGVRVRLLA